MRTLLTSLVEGLLVAIIGLVVALAGNALMGKDSIDLSHDYFQGRKVQVPGEDGNGGGSGDPPPVDPVLPEGERYVESKWFPDLQPEQLEEIPGVAGCSYVPFKHTRSFQNELTSAQARAVYDDEGRESGAILFVDARDEAKYRSGHIPGAILLDQYRFSHYWSSVEGQVLGAFVVVVYCDGGDCEDSINLAQTLKQDMGLLDDRVFIYRGGMKDWEQQGREVER